MKIIVFLLLSILLCVTTSSVVVIAGGGVAANNMNLYTYRAIYKINAVMILEAMNSEINVTGGTIIFLNIENQYTGSNPDPRVLIRVIEYIEDHCHGILVDSSTIENNDDLERQFHKALRHEHRPKANLSDIVAMINPFGVRDPRFDYSSLYIEREDFNRFGAFTHALFVEVQIPIIEGESLSLPNSDSYRCVGRALFLVSEGNIFITSWIVLFIVLVL